MPWLRLAEWFCWTLGIVLLATYAYVYLDRGVYQAYEDWAFERALSRRPAPVIGFLWDSIWTGSLQQPAPATPDEDRNIRMISQPSSRRAPAPSLDPKLIGRLEIPRLGIGAMVRAGTDNTTLRRALGHIDGTALPGQPGNVAIAGHRDTLFRALRNVRQDDRIELTTLSGHYEYVVQSLRIVRPDDVSVLDSRPGERDLTLVTCYPFYFVGHAPKRYIVRARQVDAPLQSQVSSSAQ